jgi:hypothetical protein
MTNTTAREAPPQRCGAGLSIACSPDRRTRDSTGSTADRPTDSGLALGDNYFNAGTTGRKRKPTLAQEDSE